MTKLKKIVSILLICVLTFSIFSVTASADTQIITLWYNKNCTGTVENMPSTRIFVGETIEISPDSIPTREGYAFAGWSWTPDGTEPVEETSCGPFYNDVTLYAIWKKGYASARFVIDEKYSSEYSESTKDMYECEPINSELPLPDCKISGYSLVGWRCNLDNKLYSSGYTYTLTQDVVFNAEYKPSKTVSVTFQGNITISKNKTILNKNKIEVPAYKSFMLFVTPPVNHEIVQINDITNGKTYYPESGDTFTNSNVTIENSVYFVGDKFYYWGINNNSSASQMLISSIEKDTTFEFVTKERENRFVVFLGLTGCSNSSSFNKIYRDANSTYKIPATAPYRASGKFLGWRSSNDNKLYAPGSSIKLNNDTILTAEWENYKCKVTFDLVFGEGDDSTRTIEFGEVLTFPQKPEKDGFRFAGWKDSETGTVSNVNAVTQYIYTDTHYIAQWEPDLSGTVSISELINIIVGIIVEAIYLSIKY